MDLRFPERDKFVNDEDEDDDLIVYKEQTIQVPFSMSQPSTTTNQVEVASPVANSNTNFLSRHERRKRRHEWRERQQQQQEASPSPEAPSEPNMDDPFASLQSLLDQSQQQQSQNSMYKENDSRERETDNRAHHGKPTSSFEQTTKPDAEMQHQPAAPPEQEQHQANASVEEQQKPDAAQDMELAPSPPDFVFFDGDEEDNDMETIELPALQSRSNSYSHRQTKKQRKEKMKRIRDRAPLRPLPEPEFVTPQSPLGIQNKPRSKTSYRYSNKSQALEMPHSSALRQSQPVAQVKNAKSIVGSRPTHWNRNVCKPRTTTSSQGPRQKRLAQTAALAAATRRPLMNTVTRLSPPKELRQSREIPDINMAVAPSNHTTEERSMAKPSKPTISFAPSFAPSFPTKSVDQVEESGDVQFVATRAPTRTSNFSSPPARRRNRSSKKGGTGPWTRRLAALRSSRSNDSLRLQNPAFCRQNAFDLNDPRKRANSHTDLTIIGHCAGPWVNAAEDSKLTVLGYIHRHGRTNQGDLVYENEFAWVTFTLATARSVNLQKGLQLRLYNAVVIPCRQQVTIDDKAVQGLKSNECQHIIVCTHLCEPYPSGLQPLPNIGAISTDNSALKPKE